MRKGKDVHNRGSASGRSQNVKFFKNRLTAQDVHYFRMEGVYLWRPPIRSSLCWRMHTRMH
jgi:hypothetical protein